MRQERRQKLPLSNASAKYAYRQSYIVCKPITIMSLSVINDSVDLLGKTTAIIYLVKVLFPMSFIVHSFVTRTT